MNFQHFDVIVDPESPPHKQKDPVVNMINTDKIMLFRQITKQGRTLTKLELVTGEYLYVKDEFEFTYTYKVKTNFFKKAYFVARLGKDETDISLQLYDEPIAVAINFNYIIKFGESNVEEMMAAKNASSIIQAFKAKKIDPKNLSIIELNNGEKFFVMNNYACIYQQLTKKPLI